MIENDIEWVYASHEIGFELKITTDAIDYIKSVLSVPYLRIGANKGGCSGWLYIISPEERCDLEKDIVLTLPNDINIVVDSSQASNILKKVRIFMKTLSFGTQLKIEKEDGGTHCGCGDSFS